jgi:catechol 2,3-dioxygenase-like lactoylglutathione lyase family enzyme
MRLNREAFMKANVFVALLLVSALNAGTAAAQPAPFNETGLTMGHWHIVSKDVEANKKLFVAMGGKLFMPGGNPLIMFPGLYINLILGTEKGEGGTVGSVVNHVGFIVDNVRNEHVHLSLTEADIPNAQAWYAKTFGGKPGTRNNAPIVDLPGVQIRFVRADTKQAPTRGRVLDHIGFDVKDHAAFVKKLEAEGIKLDEPVRKGSTGNTITYITDPWGTRIEIVQRLPLGPQVSTN